MKARSLLSDGCMRVGFEKKIDIDPRTTWGKHAIDQFL
jgi:hypothetical protein